MRNFLGFIGMTDVEFVYAEGLNMSKESKSVGLNTVRRASQPERWFRQSSQGIRSAEIARPSGLAGSQPRPGKLKAPMIAAGIR
ncbi:MAG: hypothetical protein M0Z73_06160 [Betaproteobacteria bacterium]|nr:hypothetical protein [Betaproteobacteria bacterium]